MSDSSPGRLEVEADEWWNRYGSTSPEFKDQAWPPLQLIPLAQLSAVEKTGAIKIVWACARDW